MKYLFWMELRRSLLQMRRYPVETALSFLILSGMFFGIAYGADAAFGNPQPAGQVATLTVLSFMGWMFCMNLLSGPAAEIEAESQSGTVLKARLESLATRYGSRFSPKPGWDALIAESTSGVASPSV